MLNDPLANALSCILNTEKTAKPECEIKPVSKIIKKVLDIMKDNQYLGDYKETKNNKGNMIKVNLLGNINKCGAIKPRLAVQKDNYEKYEKRHLPAKGMGILIISTPKGIMTNEEAKKKEIGGRLIAYCY